MHGGVRGAYTEISTTAARFTASATRDLEAPELTVSLTSVVDAGADAQGTNLESAPAPSSFTLSDPTYVGGSGTAANPFRPIGAGDSTENEDKANAMVVFGGPLTTLTLRYVNGTNGTYRRFHGIGISSMSFTTEDCPT